MDNTHILSLWGFFVAAILITLWRVVVGIKSTAKHNDRLAELQISLSKIESQKALVDRLLSQAYSKKKHVVRIDTVLEDIYATLGWRVAYWEFIEKEQVLKLTQHRGLNIKYLEMLNSILHNQIPVGGYGSGRAIATKQPVITNDWVHDPHMKNLEFLSSVGQIRSFAAFPIDTDAISYGTLHVYGERINMFKLNEVQFFTTIANILAAIFENDEYLYTQTSDIRREVSET